ncbi:MAG: glycosyltransferase family 2 protein, partial [Thermodesulfobacteriota bacterium]
GFISPVSSGAVYRREVFANVGYVDESFDAAEDVEFNYRLEKAGLTCYTAPSLKVKYYPRDSLKSLFRQLVRYGQGRRRFTRKHPQAQTFQQQIPMFFVLGLFGAIPALVYLVVQADISLLPALLVTPFAFYFLLLLGVSTHIAAKNKWHYLLILPPIFFIIHFALGWGILKEGVVGER